MGVGGQFRMGRWHLLDQADNGMHNAHYKVGSIAIVSWSKTDTYRCPHSSHTHTHTQCHAYT